MAVGRPSEYNFELCAEICEHVADGLSIRKALKQSDKYPSWATFRKWKFENAELLTQYTRAREDRADTKDDKIDDILEQLMAGEIDPQTAKVLIDTLKWQMGKENKNVYGDSSKVDVTSGGDKIQDRVVRIEVVPMESPKE